MATFGSSTANAASSEVAQPPSDTVSSLTFSPKANFLIATSWDNQVRCWELTPSGNTVNSIPKTSISHDQPVLCSAWKDDGTAVFSGGCDKQVKMWNLFSGAQHTTVAMHDAPIKDVAWVPEMNVLVTGSWDKTVKYWDTRQQTPVHTQPLPDCCYSVTVRQSSREFFHPSSTKQDALLLFLISKVFWLVQLREGLVSITWMMPNNPKTSHLSATERPTQYSLSTLSTSTRYIIHSQLLDLMVHVTSGTRTANRDLRPCQKLPSP